MPSNGFFYVYTNNESNVKVYFNDLTISHSTSVLKEENHFYPFGLLMEGITPVVAANGSINKYKFSDKEFQPELGLNQYDFSARFYDPVIGRFNVIDPFADFAGDFTSYRYAFDNPVSITDRTGLFEDDDDRGDDDLDLGNGAQGDKMPGQTFPSGTFREQNDPVEKIDPIKVTHIDEPERDIVIIEHKDGTGETKESANKSDWNDEFDERDEEDSEDAEDDNSKTNSSGQKNDNDQGDERDKTVEKINPNRKIIKQYITEDSYKSNSKDEWKYEYGPKDWGPNGRGMYFRWREVTIPDKGQPDGSRIEPSTGFWPDATDSLGRNLLPNMFWENDTLKWIIPRK